MILICHKKKLHLKRVPDAVNVSLERDAPMPFVAEIMGEYEQEQCKV